MISDTIFGLIVIISIVCFVLGYVLLPDKTLQRIFHISEIMTTKCYLFLWFGFTRFICIFIYASFMKTIASTEIFNATIEKQILLVIIPFTVVLLANAYSDKHFLKGFCKDLSLDAKESVFPSIKFFSKIVATIIVAFVLGVKDTAYELAETYDADIIAIFVFDVLAVYFATSIVCFDLVLSQNFGNHHNKESDNE